MHNAVMTAACSYWQRDPQWLQLLLTIVHPQLPGPVSKHGLQTWPARYAERLQCCIRASCVGGMFSNVRPFCVNSCLQVYFTDPLMLVWSYMINSTTKHSIATRQLLDSSAECEYTSEDTFYHLRKISPFLGST